MHNYFIIPQAKRSILATIEQETIVPVRHIDIPFESKSLITDNGYIVSLYRTNKKLRVHDLAGNLIYKEDDFCFDALNVKGNIAYLGGKSKDSLHQKGCGEIFAIIDLNHFPFKIKQVELPIQLTNGKSIDDILIRNNTLILVDDIVHPKYILEYNIENQDNPSFIKMNCLPRNGSYENIKKGDINTDYMVLFSTTCGNRGISQHIVVSGKVDQTVKRSISAEDLLSDEFDVKKYWSYKDICLIENILVLVRTDGVGYFDLQSDDLDVDTFHHIETPLPNEDRIIKTPCNQPIAINEHGYHLLKCVNNKWIDQ